MGFSPNFPWVFTSHDSSKQDRANHVVGREIAIVSGSCGDNCADAHAARRLDTTARQTGAAWDIGQQKWVGGVWLPEGNLAF